MMEKESGNEKTKVIGSEEIKSADAPGKGVTRVYDIPVKETLTVSKHRWISDEDEDVIRPVGRNTVARGETRLYGQPLGETRIYEKPQMPDDQGTGTGRAKKDLKKAASAAVSWARGIYGDLRNVKVSDSARFGRFLKVVGVFALILLLEIGYFAFAHRTRGLPDEIKETKSELELTQKETAILQQEIDELGGYDSVEEQRQSWERLKEKVEEAAAETSF